MNSTYSPLARNIILDTDSYKNDHQRMLPPATQYIYSTVIPRIANQHTNRIKVMGQQYLFKQYLTQKITMDMIKEASIEIQEQGYIFNNTRWEYIVQKHAGYLPLEIKTVPEGIILPIGLPIMTIVNTDPQCAWLVSYIETMLLRVMWKMTTVASVTYDLYNYLEGVMYQHSNIRHNVAYHLHNFGSRGADSYESDIMAGMAHLSTGFKGTDCLQANRNIKHYYNTTNAIGSSVLATEHVNISAYSTNQDDFIAAQQMLMILEQAIERFNTTKQGLPIMSIVGDTYDIYRFTQEYLGTRLKQQIIDLGIKGGRLVLRPDSGIPEIVCIKCIQILMTSFGYTTNAQGYKVLPNYLRVLQGDGITTHTIRIIVNQLEKHKLSLENLIFGMGGGLTHEAGRDEFSFSMKATAICEDNIWRDLCKAPITDMHKKSLSGRVSTFKDQTNNFLSKPVDLVESNSQLINIMETVFYNGTILKQYTFEEIISKSFV